MKRFEQGFDILLIEAGERHTNIRRARRDQADAVFIEQMQSKFLCVHTLDLHQHEIATVERVDLPTLCEARLVGDFEDAFGPCAERPAFLFALGVEFG